MTARTNLAALPNERTVEITRIFDAPRALVFKMWVDPKHMAQWWGPKGFTNPICELDARLGGKIRIDMHAPDGRVFPMTGMFREIVEPERLVFVAYPDDDAGNHLAESLTTVTFEDQDGKTKLTMHASAVGLAPIAVQMLAGMNAGWNGSLDKLAELVGRKNE
jgi:uncharacterized protein YndB with AHSA1/START domain